MNKQKLPSNAHTVLIVVLSIFFSVNLNAQEYPLPYKSPNGYIYVNKKGKAEIKEKFRCAYPFKNNIAIVQGGQSRDFCIGAINKKGKVIIPFIYNDIKERGDLMAARKGNRYAYYSKNKELLLALQDSISPSDINDGFVRTYGNDEYDYYHIPSKRYFTSKKQMGNRSSLYRLSTDGQDYILSTNKPDYFCPIDAKVYEIKVMPFCNEEIVLVKKSDRWAVLNVTNNTCSDFIYTDYKEPSKSKLYIEGINNETRHLYSKKGAFLDSLPFIHENFQVCKVYENFQIQSFTEYKIQYSELIAPSGKVLLSGIKGFISPIESSDEEPTFLIKPSRNSKLTTGIFKPPYNKLVEGEYYGVYFDDSNTMYFNNKEFVGGYVKWGSTDTVYYENKIVVDLINNQAIFLDKGKDNKLGSYIIDEDGNKQNCNLNYKSEKEYETMIGRNIDKSYYLLNSDLKIISDNYRSITRKENTNFPGKDYFIALSDSSYYLIDTKGNKVKLPSPTKGCKYTVFPYDDFPVVLIQSGREKQLVDMKNMETLFEADNISVIHTRTDTPLIWLRNKSENAQLYVGTKLLSENKSVRKVSMDPVCYLYGDEGETKLIDNSTNIYDIACQSIEFSTEHIFVLSHHKRYDKEKLYSVYIKKTGEQIFFKSMPEILESDKLIKAMRDAKPYYFTFKGDVLFKLND